MAEAAIRRVVIAGGGTAGWLAAAALAHQLGSLLDITLVESEEIGTIGVGEATIPTIRSFHAILGLDERDFVTATKASFKLGIAFEHWGRVGDRYIHSFGDVGRSTWMGEFQHFWLEAAAHGDVGGIGAYCLEHEAARAERFTLESQPPLNYAYHLDAGLYARLLRSRSEAAGVRRVEGRIARVERDGESGAIAALVLDTGARIAGDLFIDCTGFRALLIEGALGVGYEDWSHWLPTDRALAVQTQATGPAPPYTRAIAQPAGWRWRIPLQHRVGNGLVYASAFWDEEAACTAFAAELEGAPLFEPRLIRFRTGRRRAMWDRNCIALGLASGFVEPLESTSIHLVMIALTRLMQVFPFDGLQPAIVARFNRQAQTELERVRDFIILHYHLNARDEPFWRRCREMAIPASLAERIALFAEGAQAFQGNEDLFRVASWVQVMLGQGLVPRHHHRMARILGADRLGQTLATMRAEIRGTVDRLPGHQRFLDGYAPR